MVEGACLPAAMQWLWCVLAAQLPSWCYPGDFAQEWNYTPSCRLSLSLSLMRPWQFYTTPNLGLNETLGPESDLNDKAPVSRLNHLFTYSIFNLVSSPHSNDHLNSYLTISKIYTNHFISSDFGSDEAWLPSRRTDEDIKNWLESFFLYIVIKQDCKNNFQSCLTILILTSLITKKKSYKVLSGV